MTKNVRSLVWSFVFVARALTCYDHEQFTRLSDIFDFLQGFYCNKTIYSFSSVDQNVPKTLVITCHIYTTGIYMSRYLSTILMILKFYYYV